MNKIVFFVLSFVILAEDQEEIMRVTRQELKELKINDKSIEKTFEGIKMQGIDFSKSKKPFEEAVQLDNKNYLAMFYIGTYERVFNKDTKKAIEYYQKAIKLNPKNPRPYNNLAIAYGYLGDTKKSDETVKQIMTLFPEYPEGYYQWALKLLDNKKYSESTEYMKKAIEKYLNSHSDVSLSDGDRKRFEAAKVTVNYKQVLSKAKKEGTSAVYTEKEILALRAYYQSHPDEKVPDYLAESLNHFNTTGLAEGMDVSFNLADGYIQFTGGIIETAETVNAIGNGAWTGNKTWDKIKSLNEAVGNSDNMKLLDKADDLVNVADDAGRITKFGGQVGNHLGKMGVIGSLVSGASTYLERKDKYGEEVALQDAAAHTGITATSTVVGSVIGSFIPVPVVGTLFGAWVGTVVGNVLSTTYDEARHDKIEASDYKDWWKPW